RLAGRPGHQGAVAVAAGVRFADLERGCRGEEPLALVLDGIPDPRNLGAILRTARAGGIAGGVPPPNTGGGINSVVVGASAGALFGLRIVRVPNLVRAMEALKSSGFWLLGLVPEAQGSIFELALPDRVALVVGGEGDGVRPLVRRTCDLEARIPMAPGVESLNASVAAAVALFELRRPAPQLR